MSASGLPSFSSEWAAIEESFSVNLYQIDYFNTLYK
jgi:hypothetical protein